MASIFRPRYVMPIPKGAVRVTVKGAPCVRYTDGKGKVHTWPVHFDRSGRETGKMVGEQQVWWMKYKMPDGTPRREKGFRDKLATEQEAARQEREAQQAVAGILLVDNKTLADSLQNHIDAYRGSLERTGRARKYIDPVHTRLTRIARHCGWQSLKQTNPNDLEGYLAELTRQKLAPKTINEYLAAAKGFMRWCIQTRRLAGNPLEGLRRTTYQRENDKAALTTEQANKLLEVAGPNRLIYYVALRTGLRRAELEALQWGDIHLDVAHPHVALRAATTKAKRADVVPLRQDIIRELKAACPQDAAPTDKVFPFIARNSRGFLPDLDRTGIPRTDEYGKRYCFHSLRVTFGTWLAQAGVAPRVHMELMRHTDMKLTMHYYTDPRLLDTSRAVQDLPDLSEQGAQRQALRRTGSDDRPPSGGESIALNRASQRPGGSTWVHLGEKGEVRNRVGASKNADVDVEMVEAVGIEPTSGCPGPETSTRVVDPLNLGPQGSDRQDPGKPSQALISPATRPTDVPASPCVDVRPRSTGRPRRT